MFAMVAFGPLHLSSIAYFLLLKEKKVSYTISPFLLILKVFVFPEKKNINFGFADIAYVVAMCRCM